MPKKNKLREELYKDIKTMLGEGMVDVELDPRHLRLALDLAIRTYRQKASNAVQERGIIFKYKKGEAEYDMSDSDLVDIEGIYRNTIGNSTAADYTADPFLLMYTGQMMHALRQNTIYGSISTIYMQYHYLDTLEQIIAGKVQFYWNPSTKRLTIYNNIGRDEVLLILGMCYRTDEELLMDPYVRNWLFYYATAQSKKMLGEGRGKFQSLAGPGGVTMNGEQLKQEAVAELEQLENELLSFSTSDRGYGFIVG